MPTADFTALMNLLGDFYKQHENLPQFKRYWEALIRTVDNEWLQKGQVHDSLTLGFLPTYVRHTYLYRKIENWTDTGVFHRHFKKAMRSVAGQKVYYLGAFVNPGETRVYFEGKELDRQDDNYTVTNEQDTTQPGTNPRGSRLVFSQDIPGGTSLQVVSDRETFWLDETVTSPTYTLPYGGMANGLSVRLKVDAQDITGQVAFSVGGTDLRFSTPGFTNPTSQDPRRFRRGEVLRIVDPSGTVTTVSVRQETQIVTLDPAVNPLSSVFRVIGIDITPGRVLLSADRVEVPGQFFPPGVPIRVRDSAGLLTFELTEPASAIVFPRAINPDEAEVTLLSGSIYGGITIGDQAISFARAFQGGTRFHVTGDYYQLHDHASVFHVMDGVEDTVWLPRTRPFSILNTPGGIVEDPNMPVEVYVDGALIPRDDWIFLPAHETIAVRLVATGQPTPVPVGTPIAIYYADHEDDRHHKHIRDRFVTADGQFSFQLSEAHDLRYPVYPMMDGFIQANPDNYGYAGQQSFFHVTPPASDGVIVEIRGARLEYLYQADVDFDVEASMFKEDEVPPARIVWSQSLKNGIDTGVALPVQSGSVVLETGFIIEPVLSTPAGFVLKSSALYEDAWFLEPDVDEETARVNFGSVIDFDRATSDDYVRVVQALFAAYFKGSQRYTLENFACLIMGASFLDAPATLQRIQEGRDGRNALVTTLDQQTLPYELSSVVPDRLVRGSTMPKFHALTAYCRLMDLTAQNFPWLAVAAASFSEDFAFAKSFDYAKPAVITGVYPTYAADTLHFVDTTKDFVDGEAGAVWPGDLVDVQWSGGQRGYGRVVEVVDKSILKVRIDVPEVLSSYGQEAYGGGPPGKVHAYGGSRAQEYIERYTIWVRQIRRLDAYHFMDSLSSDELTYVNGVLVPLLSPFVFLARFHWEGLNEGLLEDVKHFLDTAKPTASNYIAFSNVNEDEGLVDTARVEFVEEPLDIATIPNLFAVGIGAIDGGDPVGSSIEVA